MTYSATRQPIASRASGSNVPVEGGSVGRRFGSEPLWWGPFPGPLTALREIWAILLRLLGWLLTAFAISLGGPFWVDALENLGVLTPAAATLDDLDDVRP